MPKTWHILTICGFVMSGGVAVSLAVGSSVAFVAGVAGCVGVYAAALEGRQRWASIFAASRFQAGDKRVGSTDGLGTGEAENKG